MADFILSGRIVDLILALVALEALALLAYRARTGRGPAPLPLLCNLGSGACLMLALRAGLTGAPWWQIAACLALSFAAHLGDLVARLRFPNHQDLPFGRSPRFREPGTSANQAAFKAQIPS
ncbi:hypothetical protein U8607_01260 [Methylobacterium durans]|uniref:hypothetical protein n=1 Tax=Methylobacterium durans TaxID=2202825 RepID=UPI002B003DC6|nr:hypothetical protein [Methylobacterium durans]MEA1830699.1 hypothetical protein [Methylobacterium durans]